MRCWVFGLSAVAALALAGVAEGTIVQWAVGEGGNAHYYEYVSDKPGWHGALAAAQTRVHMGMTGYLATITSQAEQDFIYNHVTQTYAAAGASDEETEGVWKWGTGPEAGTVFWKEGIGTITYADWWSQGPSDGGPGGSEDYLMINYYGSWNPKPGSGWNDYGGIGYGYLVEYGDDGQCPGGTVDITITSHPGDGQVYTRSPTGEMGTGFLTTSRGRVGYLGDPPVLSALNNVYLFQLPTIPATIDNLLGAELKLHFIEHEYGKIPKFDVDLYGLGVRDTPSVLLADWYEGSADPNNTLLVDTLVCNVDPPGEKILTGDPFLNYMKTLYYADGTPKGDYAAFRLNADPGSRGAYTGYVFGFSEHATYAPTLTLTTIPEPSTFIIWSLLGTLGMTVGSWRKRRRR